MCLCFNRFVFASKDKCRLQRIKSSAQLIVALFRELTVLVLIMCTVYLAVWEDLKMKPDAYIAVQPPHSFDAQQIVILPVSLWSLSRDPQHGAGEETLPSLLQ